MTVLVNRCGGRMVTWEYRRVAHRHKATLSHGHMTTRPYGHTVNMVSLSHTWSHDLSHAWQVSTAVDDVTTLGDPPATLLTVTCAYMCARICICACARLCFTAGLIMAPYHVKRASRYQAPLVCAYHVTGAPPPPRRNSFEGRDGPRRD